MMRPFLAFAGKPFRDLLAPIGVRGRAVVATCVILTPLLALLLADADRQYRLAQMLRADGHATAVSGTHLYVMGTILIATLWCGAAIALSGWIVDRRIVRPMRQLTLAAARLAEGELDTVVDMDRIKMNEMRRLGATLNGMARILEKLALTDSLTAVANRRQFDHAVSSEVKRASRMKKGLALLLVDVDKFKDYNDLYGHGAGDLCLQRIAQALQSTVRRQSDLVARYGGEEFVILLPDTDEDGALTIAKELLAAIRGLNIPHAAWERGFVTISIGLTVAYPPATIDPTALIERADRALYAAKLAGRDRVLIQESLTQAA